MKETTDVVKLQEEMDRLRACEIQLRALEAGAIGPVAALRARVAELERLDSEHIKKCEDCLTLAESAEARNARLVSAGNAILKFSDGPSDANWTPEIDAAWAEALAAWDAALADNGARPVPGTPEFDAAGKGQPTPEQQALHQTRDIPPSSTLADGGPATHPDAARLIAAGNDLYAMALAWASYYERAPQYGNGTRSKMHTDMLAAWDAAVKQS